MKNENKEIQKGEFVKVIKGEHKCKRGTVLKNNNGTITIRTYPFVHYIHVDFRNIARCSLTGQIVA